MHFRHLSFSIPLYHKVHSGNGKEQNLEGQGKDKIWRVRVFYAQKNMLIQLCSYLKNYP